MITNAPIPGELSVSFAPGGGTVLIDGSPLSLLASAINAHFTRAATSEAKAAEHRIAAGRKLLEARAMLEADPDDDETWGAWCKRKIARSPRDIRKVMSLARSLDPEKALEQEREARNTSYASREKVRSSGPLPAVVPATQEIMPTSAHPPAAEVKDIGFERLVSAWHSASEEARERFMGWLDAKR